MALYDLAIAYRVYPLVSRIPPIFRDNKRNLADFCLWTLKNSLGTLRAKMFVLLDDCPEEYHDIFLKYFKKKDLVLLDMPGIGNQSTLIKQIELLICQDDAETVFIAEDDYFYFPNQISNMVNLLNNNQNVEFVTPYDHLDYYRLGFHNSQRRVICHENVHFQTVGTTCLTFLTQKETLLKVRRLFTAYTRHRPFGMWLDASVWLAITGYPLSSIRTFLRFFKDKRSLAILFFAGVYNFRQLMFGRKYRLWAPLPTIGTHMESDSLSPGFAWNDVLNDYINTWRQHNAGQCYNS